MPQPPSVASRDEPVIRDRGDACPGALRLHAADDGLLARVRIPGGLLTVEQASVLGLAADRFGDGHLELTSRGNIQLRGLTQACGAGLAELLTAAGLLPVPTHERVRNIVATPVSGVFDDGRPDVTPWVGELDRLLCASARAAALSGRFLFALDDGRGDVAALDPDVTALALPAGRALIRLGAGDGALEVAAADAPRAALLAAEYFLDAADSTGTRAWRVAELPARQGLDERELGRRLVAAGIDAVPVAEVRWPYAPPPRPWGSGAGGSTALCVLPPLGRFDTAQWEVLVQVASHGDGGLRITPWRTVVLPPASAGEPVDREPVERAALIEAAGLVIGADDPWQSVTACTGRPGCAKSLADVRADARAVVTGSAGALPVHWSGCERRCGHPRGAAWVDLVATGDAYALSVHGRDPVPVGRDALAAALKAARDSSHGDGDRGKRQ
ncbi:precorrin-3B synthase [Streptomyces sp. NPDC001568]|uniref:precorrin-3B synthase n=1 Tax=Streptomyces sp. NPDC001568 TaxID=3364588 RepID=UPI0036B40E85